MDLSFNSRMEAYYQKFFELQEKLRKSEEDRLKLEMKFNELVQVSREEEQAHYKKLRSQYKKFLDEDKKRQERNEKIIRTLERIETRVNMLTSKTERIKMLRRQYQSYLQRVSRMPYEKQEYFPPKIAEELPRSESKPAYDITMLKKAFGKTNDEKIEILDKYLQNLKSQKDPIVPENKQPDSKPDFNEIKYFDEVSKKLNEGFNSNEANSIAEEIMNSIYSRHYKTDLPKNETKKVSKFTTPNRRDRYTDNNSKSGFGDSFNEFAAETNSFIPPSSEVKKDYSNVNYTSTSDKDKFRGSLYTLPQDNTKDLQMPENKRRQINFSKESENIMKSNSLLYNQDNIDFPKKEIEQNYKNYSNKMELDLKENEKQVARPIKPTETNANIQKMLLDESYKKPLETKKYQNELETYHSVEKIDAREIISPTQQDSDINSDREKENKNKNDLSNYEPLNNSTDMKAVRNEFIEESAHQLENENKLPVNNEVLEINTQSYQPNNVSDIQDIVTEPHDNNNKYKNDEQNIQYKASDEPIQYDEYNNKTMYDEESTKPSHIQQEDENQIYQKNEQLYDQVDQYDSSEQPIEQLYGENGKALEQYDESGQPVSSYEEDYNENVPSEQNIYTERENMNQYNVDPQSREYDENSSKYDENGKSIQQCNEIEQPVQQDNENTQPVQEYNNVGKPDQQYDTSGHPLQQYNGIGQPDQQYDTSGQPAQQYDDNKQPDQLYHVDNQPVQQYDDIKQPDQQYDTNGQPIQQYDDIRQSNGHYDENGQPIQQYGDITSKQPDQHYDENGQPYQQYDESGLSVQQYDENGQAFQQYDENGQPVYFGQSEGLVQYDENGQIIQQFDENGQPIQPVYNEPYQHYDDSEPVGEYDGQLLDENGQILQQYEASQYSEGDQLFEQNVPEQPQNIGSDVSQDIAAENITPAERENSKQPSNKKNVLDLLDTDTESIKQNTSKVSNDSDFDFSNG